MFPEGTFGDPSPAGVESLDEFNDEVADGTLNDEVVEGSGGEPIEGVGSIPDTPGTGISPSGVPPTISTNAANVAADVSAEASDGFFDFPFPFPTFFRSLGGFMGFGGVRNARARSVKTKSRNNKKRNKNRRTKIESRQVPPHQKLYSTCQDRITMPCVVEDFIDMGYGEEVQPCLPVHCGNSLCPSGSKTCRVETDVKPFHIGVHFGNGTSNKGGPEDNIGVCLRYRQMPC
jgi:hypothetical protein